MKKCAANVATLALASTLAMTGLASAEPDFIDRYDIARDAYIYAFPMIGAYKAIYQFNIDKTNPQYKGGFNQIVSDAEVFTPKDTAIVTPNSDTPYSLMTADLRAEPVVLCVPAIDKARYYSVQLVDLYTFNYGYIGSRATGNDAGCYMISGPSWKGETPPGIKKVFASSTDLSLAIYRTQLFNPADIENVKKIQAQYTVQPLHEFLKTAAPAPAPEINWPAFKPEAFKGEAFSYLNFLWTLTPPVPQETALRARFAEIGIKAGEPYVLPEVMEGRVATLLGIKKGYEAIDDRRKTIGRNLNGWQVGSAFGNRAFYDGNYTLRAAAALAGIFGNNAAEALYPMAKADNRGKKLDGSKHNYTITFPKDAYPPANAFWSVTMYDGKTQLLIDNPINRYLINSPMLPEMKKNPDGSLTIYVQNKTPGADKESNWLPAPNGPIYMVMRLYWPKAEALNGSWKPAPIIQLAK